MKVIAEIYNYVIEKSEIFSNVLKHLIDNLNIVTVLHKDLVLED